MEQASSFDQYKQLRWILYLPSDRSEQLAQPCLINGQVFFQEDTLVASTEGNAHFVFGGINAEEVSWFH